MALAVEPCSDNFRPIREQYAELTRHKKWLGKDIPDYNFWPEHKMIAFKVSIAVINPIPWSLQNPGLTSLVLLRRQIPQDRAREI